MEALEHLPLIVRKRLFREDVRIWLWFEEGIRDRRVYRFLRWRRHWGDWWS
jgi:hypothetical protein